MKRQLFLTAILALCCFIMQAQIKIGGVTIPKIGKGDNKTTPTTTNAPIATRFDPPTRPSDIVPTGEQLAEEDYEKYLQEKSWAMSPLIITDGSRLPWYISNQNGGDHYVKEYEENAMKLNYKEVRATLEKKGRPTTSNDAGRKYDDLLKFEQKYNENYKEYLAYQLNKSIEDAYKEKTRNVNEATQIIERSKKWIEAINYNMMDESVTAVLTKDIEKAYSDIAGKHMAAVFTSDFHKKNVGKILFSKKPIVIGKEDPNQFTTSFTATDNIYAVAYLKGSIKELTDTHNPGGKYDLIVDGTPDYTPITFGHNPEDLKNTYYLIEIIPQAGKAKHAVDAKEWAEKLSVLSPRNHKIKVNFGAPNKFDQYFANGEFDFDWTNGNGEALVKSAASATGQASDEYDKNRKLPDGFKQVSEKFSDPQLSHEKIKTMLKNSEWGDKIGSFINIIVRGAGSGWNTYTNDLGVPTSQSTQANIMVTFKGKDGWCYYVEKIYFGRFYEGGGNYGAIKLFSSDKPVRLACENVK